MKCRIKMRLHFITVELDLSTLTYLMFNSVDCEWGQFEIGECSQTCGGGMRTNNRSHIVTAEHGGVECLGPDAVNETCNIQECPGKTPSYTWSWYASIIFLDLWVLIHRASGVLRFYRVRVTCTEICRFL